jgi:hypothetical protein
MAAKMAGDFMLDPNTAFWARGDLTVSVANRAGLLLFTLRIVVTEAPAMPAER